VKVSLLIADHLELHRSVSETVLTEHLHHAIDGASRGFVVVKEVATKKEKVHLDRWMDGE